MANNFFTPPTMQPWYPMNPSHAHHHGHHHHHGFCKSCCHPIAQCVCHRDCRKVEKEVLVKAEAASDQPGTTVPPSSGAAAAPYVNKINAIIDFAAPMEAQTGDEKSAETRATLSDVQMLRLLVSRQQAGLAEKTAVIGGGCCVHLSVEYMPLQPLSNVASLSAAIVVDSQNTILMWGKLFKGEGYHIKECIISTNPGAKLAVYSLNSITRVRWCEIISC